MTQEIHITCPKVVVPRRKAVVSILGNVYFVDSYEVQKHHGQYFADGYPATPLFHSKRYYENGSSAFSRGCYLMTFVTDGQFRAHEDDTTASAVALHDDGGRLFHIQVTYDAELPTVIGNLTSYKGAWSKVGIIHFPELSADKVKEKAGLLLKELVRTYFENRCDSVYQTALGRALELSETEHSTSTFTTCLITPLQRWLLDDYKVKVKKESDNILQTAVKANTVKTTEMSELNEDNDILEVYDKKPMSSSSQSANISHQDFKALRQNDTLQTEPNDELRTRELISSDGKRIMLNKNSSKGNHCLYRAVGFIFGMTEQDQIDDLLTAVENYLVYHSSHFASHEGVSTDVYEEYVKGFRANGYGDGDVLIALRAIFRVNIMLYQRGKYVSTYSSRNRTMENTIDLMYGVNHYEAVEPVKTLSESKIIRRNKTAKVSTFCTL